MMANPLPGGLDALSFMDSSADFQRFDLVSVSHLYFSYALLYPVLRRFLGFTILRMARMILDLMHLREGPTRL